MKKINDFILSKKIDVKSLSSICAGNYCLSGGGTETRTYSGGTDLKTTYHNDDGAVSGYSIRYLKEER